MLVPTCVLGSTGIQEQATNGHDPDKFVELGSFTKVVTGTVLHRLAAAGTLALDDPIEKWLPEVPGGTGITLRNLADHTSGLPRLPPALDASPADPYASFTDASLADLLQELDKVVSGPKGGMEYSNLGYAVLGHALSVATGRTFQLLVNEHVLGPLGMAAQALSATPAPEARLVPRSIFGRPRGLWSMTGPILPAGGLWGTPRTAARLLVSLAVDQRLGEPALSWMRTGSSTWHNGATRNSSVFGGAHTDGRWVLVHRLHGNPGRTDRLALKVFKEANAP
ncbi:serine hydrolase domain-containing protein [Streptomyces xanthochromogenes]|uniref:serine hydrolase domain-containing protein n=1 Tax=Streptomyces xanthochromogenes TaxID=67384 RepID=UPI003421B9C7